MMGAPVLSLIRHLLVLHLYTKQSQVMETSRRSLYVGVVIILLLIVVMGHGKCTCIRSHKLLLNQSCLSLALANVRMHVRLLTETAPIHGTNFGDGPLPPCYHWSTYYHGVCVWNEICSGLCRRQDRNQFIRGTCRGFPAKCFCLSC